LLADSYILYNIADNFPLILFREEYKALMKNLLDSRQVLKYAFIVSAMVIAVASLVYSDMLVKSLAQEERRKMEILADAVKSLIIEEVVDYTKVDMTLVWKIIQENTTIPVIHVRDDGVIRSARNLGFPDLVEIGEDETNLTDEEKDLRNKVQKRLNKLKEKKEPIIIDFGDSYEYLYYDDSIILKRLNVYPYVQIAVVFVFIAIAFLALSSTKKAEQNRVWVGLSKETAHQLGTPISSLIAWVEYLKTKDIDVHLLDEMGKDVSRLEMIADRFSKIGSSPEPVPVDINTSILSALDYMRTRISTKVKVNTILPGNPVSVLVNDSLFAWVIENLMKNAVDAMEGQGTITFKVEESRSKVNIDISDTGKGIPKSRFKTVFNPGYTTKARGWGLGLSLVKRIIESYHNGRIFVKNSEIGKGTTFRIELKKYSV